MKFDLKVRRPLSEHEEFEIMKIVMDKFLWLGTFLLGWGLYVSIERTFQEGIYYIIAGALVMALFGWFIVKEFEFTRVK